MTMYLGLDPGFTTGAAWVSNRDHKIIIHDFDEIIWPQFTRWVIQDWEAKMNQYRQEDENVIVVCEDYIHRKVKEWSPSPVTKQIGFTYCKALDLGWHFALSQPMNKTAGYKLGKIPTTPKRHWGDALAHVYFAIHQGVDPEQKIIW